MKKNIKVLLSIFLIFFLISSCKKEEKQLYDSDISLAKIFLKQKISVGVSTPFPPFIFTEKNKFVGYDIDILTEICKRLEIELDIFPMKWSEKYNLLQSNTIDMIATGFSVTPERTKKYAMTTPFIQNAQVLVTHIDEKYSNLYDFIGHKIGVQAGSTGLAILLKELKNNGKDFKLNIYPNAIEMLNALVEKKIDGVLIDLLVASAFLKKNNTIKLKILENSIGDEKYAFAFRLTDVTLKNEIQNTLYEMAEDGVLEKITRKWFGANICLIR